MLIGMFDLQWRPAAEGFPGHRAAPQTARTHLGRAHGGRRPYPEAEVGLGMGRPMYVPRRMMPLCEPMEPSIAYLLG